MSAAAAARGGRRRIAVVATPALSLLLALLLTTAGAASALTAQPQSRGPDTRVVGASSAALVQRAQRALDERRWAQAVELWQRALAADARAPEHWNALGVALLEAGRPRESTLAFGYAFDLSGGRSRDAAWNLARAHAVLGERAEVSRWIARARALVPRPSMVRR